MRNRLAVLVVVSALLLAHRADAGTFTFKQAKVTLEIPATWTTDDQGGYVTFASKDQTVAINLAFAGDDVDKAWDLLVDQVNKVVSGVKVSKKAGVLSGMDGYVDSGKGTLSGSKVECMLAVLKTPGGAMTVFVLGQTGKYEKHADELNAVLNGMSGGSASGGMNPSGGDVTFPQDYPAKPDVIKFTSKLVSAINKNDAKGFIKLVSKKGLSQYDGETTAVVKGSKLKKAIKKAGTVAGFLGVAESGAWNAELSNNGELTLYRGDGTGVVTYLMLGKVGKAWAVTGTFMEDHGVDEETGGE